MEAYFETKKEAVGAVLRVIPQTSADKAGLNLIYRILKDRAWEDIANIGSDDSLTLTAFEGE